jgi:hypothetical protein
MGNTDLEMLTKSKVGIVTLISKKVDFRARSIYKESVASLHVYEPIKSVERNNSQSRKEKVGNPH